MHCEITGSTFYYSTFLTFSKMLGCCLRVLKMFQIILYNFVLTVFSHSLTFVFIHFSKDLLGVFNMPGTAQTLGNKTYRPCSKEVERLAKEKEIFKQIFIVNMVIMICIGTVLVKRGNVFLLAQEKKKKFQRKCPCFILENNQDTNN